MSGCETRDSEGDFCVFEENHTGAHVFWSGVDKRLCGAFSETKDLVCTKKYGHIGGHNFYQFKNTSQQEVTVTDPESGGKKGLKLARMDLLPPDWEIAVSEHYGKGALKYDDRNWEKGYKWSLSYGALRRHLAQWWGGEDIDAETGSSHLLAVAFHAIALWVFQHRGLGTDDRPKR